MTWPLFFAALGITASGLCFFSAGVLVGMRKGRELERMELSPRATWHFQDGAIRTVWAESAVEAAEALITSTPTISDPFTRSSRVPRLWEE